MRDYYKGKKEFSKYATNLKQVPLTQRLKQDRHVREGRRDSQNNFLRDMAIRDRAAKTSHWKMEEKVNQEVNSKMKDKRVQPKQNDLRNTTAGFIPQFHHTDLQYPKQRDEPFSVGSSLALSLSKMYSQHWSSTDQNILNQLNVYVESEEVERARAEAARIKRENQEFTFKENNRDLENQGYRPTHVNYSLAGEELWRKKKKTQRMHNQEIEYEDKENVARQEENPMGLGRWVRFNVNVQNGRHKFADYREVGGETQIRTVDDLAQKFKYQLQEDGLPRDEMRDEWELRSSRGYKFEGNQRVSTLYKFKERNEVDLQFGKKQRIGREHCFERGDKLYKIIRCVDWKRGIFEVEWRDQRDPFKKQRGEADIDELEREAKEELYAFMKNELNQRV